MKKIISLALTLVMVLSLCACGGGQASTPENEENTPVETSSSSETYQWRLAHEEYEGEYQYYFAEKFKEIIEAKSEGRISVDVYSAGMLGDATSQVELLQVGGVEFAVMNPGNVGSFIPEANIFNVHFVLPDTIEGVNAVLDNGEGIAYLNDLYVQNGFYPIQWNAQGFNQWIAHKPLLTPADFSGLKMRTMNAAIITESYRLYGADPIFVAYAEVYSALQLGMVDAHTNPTAAIRAIAAHEVTSDFTIANPDCFVSTLCANVSYWETLPDDIKQMVHEAAAEASEYVREIGVQLEEDAYAAFEEAGIKIHELTPEQREAFAEIARANRHIFTDVAGEGGQKLLDLFAADCEKFG